MEFPIVIESRDELIYLLSEASQLEHMIFCQYLFAAFSLKRDPGDGLTAEQAEAARRWERTISGVAGQEMRHLSQLTNLLTAVGAGPYLTHPNFPQRARYFPPDLQFALLPFGEDALLHFLHLERPEGMKRSEAPEFAEIGPDLPPVTGAEIVPVVQDFSTIGHFYREIERGLRQLAERHGEQRLFTGPPEAQATERTFGWPELIPVTGLESATTAIEMIIKEGEGARGLAEVSHYGRFLQILDEYRALRREDPGFEPAHPAVAATARPPADVTEPVVVIEDPVTAAVADLFNASYELLLQMLARFFLQGDETQAEQQTLGRVAVQMMFGVIKPLGQLLPLLPVGPNLPGKTAGATFEIFPTGYLLPHRRPAWTLMHERLLELADAAARIEAPVARAELEKVEQNLRHYAAVLDEHLDPVGAA